MTMITIDGVTYQVPVKSLKRSADFLDKSAFRTQNGVLHRELIGVYFNYQLQFGRVITSAGITEYAALWNKLTEAVPFHTVVVPKVETGNYTFTAYFANVGDELLAVKDTVNFWQNLTVNFIAQSPAET
jgi:hypothetical protein